MLSAEVDTTMRGDATGGGGMMWRRAFSGGLKGERGVTLIEAVFALVILTVGLLSLYALHHAAITATQLSFRMSEATFLAQDMMDQLNAAEYTRENPHTASGETFEGTTHPTDPDDPLADYEHYFDGDGVKVGCLGAVGSGGGAAIYTRTYDIEHIADDDYGRMIIRARASFQMGETGKKHGVTLISTRSYDRYP